MKRLEFVGEDVLGRGKGMGHPLLLRDGSEMNAEIELGLRRSASLDRSTAVRQKVIAVDPRHQGYSPPYPPSSAHDLVNCLKVEQGLGEGNEEFRDEIVRGSNPDPPELLHPHNSVLVETEAFVKFEPSKLHLRTLLIGLGRRSETLGRNIVVLEICVAEVSGLLGDELAEIRSFELAQRVLVRRNRRLDRNTAA